MMDIQKEREAFDEEFGVSEFNMFATGDENLDQSLVLKCNWLGWKTRAELEYKENPDAIKISGLKTITKLCKFGADHNMEGCSFAEIVERMFDEVQQAQKVAVPEGFVLVPREPTLEMIAKGHDVFVGAFDSKLNGGQSLHCAYLAMIEAQEPAND